MKKKVMISQSMQPTPSYIEAQRERAKKMLEGRGYEVVNTYFKDEWAQWDFWKAKEAGITNEALYFLAKAIDRMAHCDAVYFCSGWDSSRGCRIEHIVAQRYGLDVFYEDMEDEQPVR